MDPQICKDAIADYLAYVKSGFDATPSDKGCFLATPFVRPDGEGVEIEIEVLPDGYISISDMGDTFGYLYVNGMTLSQNLIKTAQGISKTHGVTVQRNLLSVEVDADSIGEGIHSLSQAILGVTDLVQKRRVTTRIRFNSEVESLIIYSGVAYDVDYTVRGWRESHTIKFHVNSGRSLLIQPIAYANESSARSWSEHLAYRFGDIIRADPTWRPVVLLDDRGDRDFVWAERVFTPIRDYAIPWSRRHYLEQMLIADAATR